MNRTGAPPASSPIALDVACVVDAKDEIGETPVWSDEQQLLYWSDLGAGRLHSFDPASQRHTEKKLPDYVTSINLAGRGRLLLTLRKHLASYDVETETLTRLVEVESELPGNRFNDGKCDPQGRLWAGTMGDEDWDSPLGSLYRFGKAGRHTAVRREVCCSNGLTWSPDHKTFYFTESFRHRIHAYDYDAATGEIENPRVFATVDPNGGAFPDGLTIDEEGFIWSAQPAFGHLVRYDPTGKIERIIDLPVSRGTSCCFGGADLDILFVTTAQNSLSASQLTEEPIAGALLALSPGVKGLPQAPYQA